MLLVRHAVVRALVLERVERAAEIDRRGLVGASVCIVNQCASEHLDARRRRLRGLAAVLPELALGVRREVRPLLVVGLEHLLAHALAERRRQALGGAGILGELAVLGRLERPGRRRRHHERKHE